MTHPASLTGSEIYELAQRASALRAQAAEIDRQVESARATWSAAKSARIRELEATALTEEERQLVVLALALCALLRPGFEPAALRPLARKFSGEELFLELRRLNADVIPAQHVLEKVRPALTGASHALKSYQFGNSARDLAKSTAESIDLLLADLRAGLN